MKCKALNLELTIGHFNFNQTGAKQTRPAQEPPTESTTFQQQQQQLEQSQQLELIMQQQVPENIPTNNLEPIKSTSTTTNNNNDNANGHLSGPSLEDNKNRQQYFEKVDQYCNNQEGTYLAPASGPYYCESLVDQPAQVRQAHYYATHQGQYNATNQQQPTQDDPAETLSLALEEIGAIINGKEFRDLDAARHNETNNNNYQQVCKRESVIIEETPASIYEDIKSIIGQPDQLQQEQDFLFINMMTNPAPASNNNGPKPYLEIIEQPSKCALRFRYKCEGRSAGSLPGVNSTADNKTFPTIRINNYNGRAVVVISCVTKDAPYRAHPHNLVGKEGCKKGICTIVLNSQDQQQPQTSDEKTNGTNANNTNHQPLQSAAGGGANAMTRTFSSLGIQCVKRKDIEDSLNLRESINVDPFRNGFQHKLDTSSIDLNVIRLCFQVFITGSNPNKCDVPLTPIVSEPIHDKKAMSDLVITKLSHCSAPATGGREVILLCDRIAKDDIQVRFFEESRDGELIWETHSDISPADVHKQVAICFRTPKYYNENITQPVMARIQLRRISDNQVSEPRLFQFLPCESDEDIISRKRQKIEWVVNNHYAHFDNILQQGPSTQQQQQTQHHQQHPPQQHLQQAPHDRQHYGL